MFSLSLNSCNLSLILLYFVYFLTLQLLFFFQVCSPLLIHFDFGGETHWWSFSALIAFSTELWFCPCPQILHKRNLSPGCIMFSWSRGCFSEPFPDVSVWWHMKINISELGIVPHLRLLLLISSPSYLPSPLPSLLLCPLAFLHPYCTWSHLVDWLSAASQWDIY